MTKHRTGTRKEWLSARLELLEAEPPSRARQWPVSASLADLGKSVSKVICRSGLPFSQLSQSKLPSPSPTRGAEGGTYRMPRMLLSALLTQQNTRPHSPPLCL